MDDTNSTKKIRIIVKYQNTEHFIGWYGNAPSQTIEDAIRRVFQLSASARLFLKDEDDDVVAIAPTLPPGGKFNLFVNESSNSTSSSSSSSSSTSTNNNNSSNSFENETENNNSLESPKSTSSSSPQTPQTFDVVTTVESPKISTQTPSSSLQTSQAAVVPPTTSLNSQDQQIVEAFLKIANSQAKGKSAEEKSPDSCEVTSPSSSNNSSSSASASSSASSSSLSITTICNDEKIELVTDDADATAKGSMKRLESEIDSNDDDDEEARKKRKRRKAVEIDRSFKCSMANCQKVYGSENALKMHIKLKHPEYQYLIMQQTMPLHQKPPPVIVNNKMLNVNSPNGNGNGNSINNLTGSGIPFNQLFGNVAAAAAAQQQFGPRVATSLLVPSRLSMNGGSGAANGSSGMQTSPTNLIGKNPFANGIPIPDMNPKDILMLSKQHASNNKIFPGGIIKQHLTNFFKNHQVEPELFQQMFAAAQQQHQQLSSQNKTGSKSPSPTQSSPPLPFTQSSLNALDLEKLNKDYFFNMLNNPSPGFNKNNYNSPSSSSASRPTSSSSLHRLDNEEEDDFISKFRNIRNQSLENNHNINHSNNINVKNLSNESSPLSSFKSNSYKVLPPKSSISSPSSSSSNSHHSEDKGNLSFLMSSDNRNNTSSNNNCNKNDSSNAANLLLLLDQHL